MNVSSPNKRALNHNNNNNNEKNSKFDKTRCLVFTSRGLFDNIFAREHKSNLSNLTTHINILLNNERPREKKYSFSS